MLLRRRTARWGRIARQPVETILERGTRRCPCPRRGFRNRLRRYVVVGPRREILRLDFPVEE